MENIVKKLNIITNAIADIKEENETFGTILAMNYDQSLLMMDSMVTGDDVDLSEQIKTISTLLGYDLEEIIIEVMKKNEISSEETDQEAIDFITSNSNINTNNEDSVDKYKEFLEESKVNENMGFLKEEL